MCWVLPAEGTLANQKFIVLKSFTSHADPYYQYGLLMIDKPDYPKHVGFALSIDGQFTECEAPESDFDYDEWLHLAGTYDGSEMRLYLDGVEVATNSVSGKVDEVAVLDVVLTADEIKQVMTNGVQKTILAVDSRGKLTTSWGEIKL